MPVSVVGEYDTAMADRGAAGPPVWLCSQFGVQLGSTLPGLRQQRIDRGPDR